MSKNEDYFPIEGNIEHVTPKAVLIYVGATPEERQEDADAGKHWFPLFAVLEDVDQSWIGLQGVELNIIERFLEEKGLV
jgi:hypothetical protein